VRTSRYSRRTRGDISVYRKQTVVCSSPALPAPFVSCNRKTLKSRNLSALNLPNDEEKTTHPPTRTAIVNAPFVRVQITHGVYGAWVFVHLFARSCLQFPRAAVCVRVYDAHDVCRWTFQCTQDVPSVSRAPSLVDYLTNPKSIWAEI
jgi:hypothetical protein